MTQLTKTREQKYEHNRTAVHRQRYGKRDIEEFKQQLLRLRAEALNEVLSLNDTAARYAEEGGTAVLDAGEQELASRAWRSSVERERDMLQERLRGCSSVISTQRSRASRTTSTDSANDADG